MVRIIDKSRGESVGKIEDTGSFSTDDALLEEYLERFVEEGVTTLVAEHTNTGVNYRIGKVEVGEKGFARAVLQHLPSPYYGDVDEMHDLPDYDVVENRQEDKSPVRGKQGGMNTVNRFTSLASQSSAPTRERVDADWNDIIDEENLPESSKARKTIEGFPDYIKATLLKYRVYISDRSNAPDWADVEEGPQGGLYYEVGGSEGQARLGEPASEAPANVPDNLDLRNVEEWISWDDTEDKPGAFAEDEMSIGRMKDGSRVFITNAGPPESRYDHETIRSNRTPQIVHQTMDMSDMDEEKKPKIPEMHINEEIMSVVAEDVGAQDSLNVGKYFSENYGFRNYDEAKENHNKESLISAIAFKGLVGDTDIGGNIVTSSDGMFYAIDMDLSGKYIPDRDEEIRDVDDVFDEDLEGYWDKLTDNTPAEAMDVTKEEIKERAKELASRVDVESMRNSIDEDMHASSSEGSSRRDNYLQNVQYLRTEEDDD